VSNILVRLNLLYVYKEVHKQPIFYCGWENKNDVSITPANAFYKGVDHRRYIQNMNDNTIVHSELFRSVQMTTGIWHQLAMSSSGHHYATNFFERRIAVGLIEYFVDTTNRSTEVKINWYDDASGHFGMAWEALKKGDIIGAISYAVQGAISLIWNGLQAFLGWIHSVFVKIWDALVKVGKFIYTVLQEFWGQILSIINDIVSGAEKVLEIMLYVIAIIIFAYVISWSTRFIFITRGGMDD
jgi:hypothetical protein